MLRPETESQGGDHTAVGLPYIVIGSARLPSGTLGEKPGALMIEFVLDGPNGRVSDVTTNIPLPGYNRLLRGLLVGACLADIEDITRRLPEHVNGAFVKPSLAALANAAGQVRRQSTVAS